MFEAAACCRTALVAAPSVSVEALRELRVLLSAIAVTAESGVLKAEHLSPPDPGGACATHKGSALLRPADAVSSAVEDPAMDEFPDRGARADAEAARAVSQAPSPRTARRAGGAR